MKKMGASCFCPIFLHVYFKCGIISDYLYILTGDKKRFGTSLSMILFVIPLMQDIPLVTVDVGASASCGVWFFCFFVLFCFVLFLLLFLFFVLLIHTQILCPC